MPQPDAWPFAFYNAKSVIAGVRDFDRLRRTLNLMLGSGAQVLAEVLYAYRGNELSQPTVWVMGSTSFDARLLVNCQSADLNGIALGADSEILVGVDPDNSSASCVSILPAGVVVNSDQSLTPAIKLLPDGSVEFSDDGNGGSNKLWRDQTRRSLCSRIDGTTGSLSAVLFSQTADATVANTVTETSIIGTGVGSTTLGASFLAAGKALRFESTGKLSTDSTPGTLVFKFKAGSTVIAATPSYTPIVAMTDWMWRLRGLMTCRTTGGSGTVMCIGTLELIDPAPSGVSSPPIVIPLADAGATIDTGSSQAMGITVTHGTAAAANSVTSQMFVLEQLN